MGGQRRPIRLQPLIRVLQQRLGIHLQHPQLLVSLVDFDQRLQHGIDLAGSGSLAVGAKCRQLARHSALAEHRFQPPCVRRLGPFSEQFGAIELGKIRAPAGAGLGPMFGPGLSMLDEQGQLGARLGVMGLACKSGRHLGRREQQVSQRIDALQRGQACARQSTAEQAFQRAQAVFELGNVLGELPTGAQQAIAPGRSPVTDTHERERVAGNPSDRTSQRAHAASDFP